MTPVASSAPLRGRSVVVLAFGVALGYALSRIGFTSYTELHAMFVFADLRLFFVFTGGVAAVAVGLFATRRFRSLPRRAIHRGTIVGGVLFGLGWAIAGACPGVAFVQLGEGKLWALASLAGIVAGTLACSVLQRSPRGHALLGATDRCG